ncbi:DUF5331 domain-containing protein [Trichocoleus sp. ST-U2]|uniref:DUF5331 domain-containing protein n=1 Tax=Trichocoleus sp. ST-U2 TaxID=2933929 RepID=UPI0032980793
MENGSMLLVSILTCVLLCTILQTKLFSPASASSPTVNTEQLCPEQLHPEQLRPEQLRESVRAKWLDYYRRNRHWLNRLQVWVTSEGQRRPTSSFILATLSTLDPQFNEMLPLIVDLNADPDRIVASFGLDFDPDDELEAIPAAPDDELEALSAEKTDTEEVRMLPPAAVNVAHSASRIAAKVDESCEGVYKKHRFPWQR